MIGTLRLQGGMVDLTAEPMRREQLIPGCTICGKTASGIIVTEDLPGTSPVLLFACSGHAYEVNGVMNGHGAEGHGGEPPRAPRHYDYPVGG